MKQNSFFYLLAVIALWSCQNQSKQQDNALLPSEIIIKYETELNAPDGSQVISSLEKTDFVSKLINTVLSGKVAVYEPLDTAKNIVKSNLTKLIGTWNDTLIAIDKKTTDTVMVVRTNYFNQKELRRILFEESWSFNSQKFTMKKDIRSWCAVRVYNKQIDSVDSEEVKKMLFWVKQKPNEKRPSNCTLLKSGVITEFSLYNQNVPEWLQDLNPKRFIQILLDNIYNKKVIAFDYFDQKKQLTEKEVKENLGETAKIYSIENKKTETYDTLRLTTKIDLEEVQSVLFIEDWYIDWNTLHIFKQVKSIAPIRTYLTSHDGYEDEIEKKIVFLVHLKE